MAALNFPDPEISTTYTANGKTWTWDGTSWVASVAGATGYTGSQGDQGPIGYTGSASTVQGPIGYTGSKGEDGTIGIDGYTGSQGPIGYTGSASTVQGPIGYTGSQGDQGPIGYTGSRGATGYTGSQGDQGPIGYTGSAASGSTLSDDTSTDVNQYIGMSRSTSGAWTDAYVASTKLYFNPSTGTTYSTVFQSLSDVNQKDNINTINNSIDIINQLKGVEFTWKDTGNKSSGVIAQEIEQVLPHLVSVGQNNQKTVNYDGIIAYLIESIKELSEKVKHLESK
jgi:hypothetical protein